MSSAVNMFLHQCVLRGGLPFSVEIPHYSQHTLDAMEEARRISRDPNVKGCQNMEELKSPTKKKDHNCPHCCRHSGIRLPDPAFCQY